MPEDLESGIITATGTGERGEGGGRGGMITTLFHPVTRPATGEMGEGRGKGGGGQRPCLPARPVIRPATGEKGGRGGMTTSLFHG